MAWWTSDLDSTCMACGEGFYPDSPRQRTCKTCTPDKGWMHRFRRYGVTKPMYDKRFEEQEGKCPLCLEPLRGDFNTTVDHDHDTEEFRGILCRGCNMVLSRFEDPEYVARIFKYLKGRR